MNEAALLEEAAQHLYRWFKGPCDCTTTKGAVVICTNPQHGSRAQFKEWLKAHWRRHPQTRPRALDD